MVVLLVVVVSRRWCAVGIIGRRWCGVRVTGIGRRRTVVIGIGGRVARYWSIGVRHGGIERASEEGGGEDCGFKLRVGRNVVDGGAGGMVVGYWAQKVGKESKALYVSLSKVSLFCFFCCDHHLKIIF